MFIANQIIISINIFFAGYGVVTVVGAVGHNSPDIDIVGYLFKFPHNWSLLFIMVYYLDDSWTFCLRWYFCNLFKRSPETSRDVFYTWIVSSLLSISVFIRKLKFLQTAEWNNKNTNLIEIIICIKKDTRPSTTKKWLLSVYYIYQLF